MSEKPKKPRRKSKAMDQKNSTIAEPNAAVPQTQGMAEMNAPQQMTATPAAPLAPGTPPPKPIPPVGSYVMALSPAVNGTWQMSRVVENPTNPSMPLIEFQDGTQYFYNAVQYSDAQVAPNPVTAPNPANPSHIDLIGGLAPRYQQFRDELVRLNAGAHELFQLPLDAVMKMARRNAFQQQLDSTGRMDTIGNEGQLIPDMPTFERWLTSYLQEVQRREQNATAGPNGQA